MKQLLLAITVYNCEGRIIKVLNKLDDSIMKYIKEILVLDTDSTDRTKEDIRAYQKKHKELPIKILTSKSHPGQGSAVKKAFCYALKNNYRYLMILNGDNQTKIKDFLPVLKNARYKKYDSILGARFIKGSRLQNYSKIRILGNVLINLLYSLLCKHPIYDVGSGLNMYSVKKMKEHRYTNYPDNQLFFAMMLLKQRKLKQNLIFYPISSKEDRIVFPMKSLNKVLFLLMWGMKGAYCKKCSTNCKQRFQK